VGSLNTLELIHEFPNFLNGFGFVTFSISTFDFLGFGLELGPDNGEIGI
jgi:hypothetical protein